MPNNGFYQIQKCTSFAVAQSAPSWSFEVPFFTEEDSKNFYVFCGSEEDLMTLSGGWDDFHGVYSNVAQAAKTIVRLSCDIFTWAHIVDVEKLTIVARYVHKNNKWEMGV